VHRELGRRVDLARLRAQVRSTKRFTRGVVGRSGVEPWIGVR
jgi:hypothetical protein